MNTGAQPSTADLLDRLVEFVRRFVVFSSQAQSDALALWVLHCWALAAADVSPYVVVTSPEKKCGKSRLLDVLALLVARAWRIDAAPTEAVLFRKIDADTPTLLLDEADALFANARERTEPLRAIFNSGNRRGTTVPRCVGKDNAVRDFSIFCAKLLAGIDASRWPDTIRDRAVIVELRRKHRGEVVERFRYREVASVADVLRDCCECWAVAAVDTLRAGRPELPNALDDRAADSWEPLFAIANLAGGDWPERARAAALQLSAGRNADDDGSLGVRLLADVRAVLGVAQNLSTETLLERLNALDESPWGGWRDEQGLDARTLARRLKPYGIKPRTVRLPDGSTPKGYKREQFSDAFARYLPLSQEPPQAPQAPHPSPGRNGDVADVADVADPDGYRPATADEEARIGRVLAKYGEDFL